MAPEQAAGRPIDFRADQFALGSLIYEMITGRRAFKRDTPVQTMAAIIDAEPEPIAELAPETPDRARDDRRAVSRQRSGAPLRVDTGPGHGICGISGTFAGSRTSARPASRSTQRRGGDGAGSAAAVAARRGPRRSRSASAIGRAAPLAQARALLDRFDKQANVDQAIGLLSSIASEAPTDPVAHTMLAEAYWREVRVPPAGRDARRIGPAKGRASRSR